ncbi:SpoIID/LytB domain-containing protein [Petroclostridium sp. X23]|uniref:SpoIID/LytB domain-containing protein n=1 Tax=Petroclostridium sp. X23 TaxID=3045146 RepID=UPI0024AD61B5|nr:SpoIID/LytB domain-containing protein [Petroclostridium sp. X23]WHH59025.1 SpoIID/LytB domain-containing protein [Petroclostridium sp. X23]
MKIKTDLAIIVLIAVVLGIFSSGYTAYAYAGLPEKIRIGIYFEKSAPASIDINSDTGFQIGYEKDGQFLCLSTETSNKSLVVRKDTYFINTGNVLLEYSPNNPGIPSGTKYGPYHIQVGGSYANYDLAMQAVNSLRQQGFKAFPAFIDGSFKVWIGLHISKEDAQIELEQVKQADAKESKVISPSATSVLVLQKGKEVPELVFDSSPFHLLIQPVPSKDTVPLVSINGKKYRGAAEFKRITGSDMTVINLIDLEQYLYGVLPREMGGDWPLEALKAQAVAARTYAALHINKYANFGFNLCSTTASQVYGGYSSENSNCNRAVEETRGKVLTYNGSPAYIYYFSSSGGHTEDIRNVWGGSGVPYLVGVEDAYEPTDRSSKGIWSLEMTPEKVEGLLKAQNYDLGKITSVQPIEFSAAGRVVKLKIIGTKGEHVFERDKTRTIFGANFVNSQYYTVKTDSDIYIGGKNTDSVSIASGSGVKVISSSGVTSINTSLGRFYAKGANTKKSYAVIPQSYIFEGKGWGHGVGLSQWGALGMAENGFKYNEILEHYFPGTKVE